MNGNLRFRFNSSLFLFPLPHSLSVSLISPLSLCLSIPFYSLFVNAFLLSLYLSLFISLLPPLVFYPPMPLSLYIYPSLSFSLYNNSPSVLLFKYPLSHTHFLSMPSLFCFILRITFCGNHKPLIFFP